MDKFLANLLPRLKEYGQELNKTEQFVDKVWIVNEDGVLCTYRFRRNGTLLVTVNGNVREWKWEYIKPDAVYINKDGNGVMFRHGFVLDGLLILKKEAPGSPPLIFYNEEVVKNGDIEAYLFMLMESHLRYRPLGTNKKYLYFDRGIGLELGTEVYDREFNLLRTGVITVGNQKIGVTKGSVTSIGYNLTVKTDSAPLHIYCSNRYKLEPGDKASLPNGSPATGRFKLMTEGGATIFVENGEIVKVSYIQRDLKTTLFIVGFFLVILLIVLFFWER